MHYTDGEQPLCTWSQCRRQAVAEVYNTDMTEAALVCGEHRKLALYNLDVYGKIRPRPGTQAAESERPTNEQPVPQVAQQSEAEEWEVEAARRADQAAVPVDQPEGADRGPGRNIVGDHIQPRR